VFSGLVKLGPDGRLVPDLASRWESDTTGETWTFSLRPEARWHDGEPVTADDVVFTIGTLRDPDYTGPGAGSWREVTATAIDERTVRFELETPLGGFLNLATQPIAPAHLLADVPVDALDEDPFTRMPIGSGPFAVAELDDNHAVLAAASAQPAADSSSGASPSALPSDALATAAPTRRPAVAAPQISRLEFRFFDDPSALEDAFDSGDLDAASGLMPARATKVAATDDTRALRYPGTTLTTVVLNLRPTHPELRDPRVRTALLAAIDRPGLIQRAFAGEGQTAEAPIPPTSWAFDPVASPPVAHDVAAAAAALTKAGWKKVDERWRPAGASKPYSLELLSPDRDTNPVLFGVAERVAKDWEALGLTVNLVEEEAGTLLTDHLQEGTFTAAVIDIAIGHDPDLYPLLASSQTRTGGLNVIGLQDPTLDPLLVKARQPGPDEARAAAYTALQKQLSAGRYLLPLCFADEVVVVRDRLQGPVPQPVADRSDRFWDVLTWRLANDR
jgi:peptide/nickel transport system substrate-binding protein